MATAADSSGGTFLGAQPQHPGEVNERWEGMAWWWAMGSGGVFWLANIGADAVGQKKKTTWVMGHCAFLVAYRAFSVWTLKLVER